RGSLSLRGPITEVLTLACQSAKLFAQSSAENLADGYAKNFSHLSNPLFIPFVLTLGTGNIEMPRVVKMTFSEKSMGYSDRLKNKQTPYLQSGDHWFRRYSSLVTELH
ncbi:hypothetical protein ABLB69_19820, partial [Xenorhabdus khoisanae]|uniref:hypothetical protein n=1 Tax=Xenorhabdus khoisanae TaxID=880157 RepID=UPI0032B85972